MDLDTIKRTVESFNKKHQLGILKIIKETTNSTINENKSGIYINMTFLSEETLDKIRQYIAYVQDQEQLLKTDESEKQDIKNTFFLEKEHRDNML
jgi:hypothetical protein